MDFLVIGALFLSFLFLAALALVEGPFLTFRAWSRFFYWRRSRRLSSRRARFGSGSMRRYARARGASPWSLGQLRVTRSRAEEFGQSSGGGDV